MKVRLQVLTYGIKAAVLQAAALSEAGHPNTSCRRGCAHCCSRLVAPSIGEAMVMREELVRNGSWTIVLERAKLLTEKSVKTPAMAWFRMNISCPVLNPDTRECMAYNVRPAACSSHAVTSDPSSCDPWSLKGMNYKPVDPEPIIGPFRRRMNDVAGSGILSMNMPMAASLTTVENMKETRNLSAEEVIELVGRETG